MIICRICALASGAAATFTPCQLAFITDLGSLNKTFLLGQNNMTRKMNRVLVPHTANQLNARDYFALGDCVFCFEWLEVDSASQQS